MKKQNLFSEISGDMPDEIFEEIVTCEQVKIERIVSKGHASPDNFWYDQEKNEWVMVVKGRAVLVFEGEGYIEVVVPVVFVRHAGDLLVVILEKLYF